MATQRFQFYLQHWKVIIERRTPIKTNSRIPVGLHLFNSPIEGLKLKRLIMRPIKAALASFSNDATAFKPLQTIVFYGAVYPLIFLICVEQLTQAFRLVMKNMHSITATIQE